MTKKSPSSKPIKLPLPLSRVRKLASGFRCLDCRRPNTVVRGTVNDQLRTKGQFLCRICGGNRIARNI